jgi:YfiH family protein
MPLQNNLYIFKNLSTQKSLVHGISTKKFGSMKQSDGGLDCDNLEKFRAALGLSDRAVCMQQVHGNHVVIVTNTNDLQIPETDGIITKQKHIPLAVVTADCLPVLFYDTKKEIIGAAHAGYKGIAKRIIRQMLSKFQELGSKPEDITVSVGPGIGICCYAVGQDRIELFQKTFPEYHGYYRKEGNQYFLDLKKLALLQLLQEGIAEKQIEIADICTVDSVSEFHSYRKEGEQSGRFVSIISMRS